MCISGFWFRGVVSVVSVRCGAVSMPLVVLPSEITEGPLPRQKCLRGFVVEKRRRTLASGKMVVELHVAAKNEPGEVYYLEA